MLDGARVLVTGSRGFLGQHLYRLLVARGATVLGVGGVNRKYQAPDCHDLWLDLCDLGWVEKFFQQNGPFDYVFHLAGHNGGIAFNGAYPADIFMKNTVMGLNLLDCCARHGVKKALSVVASCAYGDGQGDLVENNFLCGQPNASVACHGYAKRNLLLASRFYRQQYGLEVVTVCPTTCYGPGDSFDPARTKVMGAMVRRFVDAVDFARPATLCWGTGTARREFLYAEDCASLMLRALLHDRTGGLLLNLGTGQELTTRELAEKVAAIVGYTGPIVFDGRHDGQASKRLDCTLMRSLFPDFQPTPLEEGIRRTVDWYTAVRDSQGGQQ